MRLQNLLTSMCEVDSGIHHMIIFTRLRVIHTASDDSCGSGLGTRLHVASCTQLLKATISVKIELLLMLENKVGQCIIKKQCQVCRFFSFIYMQHM